MRGRALIIGGVAIIIAASAPSIVSPTAARADSPSGPYAVTPQTSATFTNSAGVVGWPDPNGPPAPGCPTASCDQQQVTFGAGSSPPTDTFSLTLAVTYTSTNTTIGNCLDIAIEDSTASTVFAKQNCAPSGGTITDPNVAAGTTYTVEIDADAANGAAVPAQPFSATVSAAATAPSGGGSGPTPTPLPTNPFTFTHEVSVDVQHGDGEPDLAISSDNNSLYTATPWGFSTTVSLLYKSSDGGVQWNNLHGSAVGEACPNPTAVILRPDCSRGGGDAEVQLSAPSAAGGPQTVQFVDLNGLDSLSCAYSSNGGDTFTDLLGYGQASPTGSPEAGAACNEGGTANSTNCASASASTSCATLGTDRQWMQVWPKADQPSGATSDKLYMTFDTGDQPPSGDASIYSNDNGQSWTIGCSTTTSSSCVGGPHGVGARPGPLVINPTLLNTVATATGVIGGTYPTLYEFMGTSTNGTEVNISCDGGQTWNNVATSNGQAGSTTNDFVAGAMDSNGELYTAYTVANDPNPWRVWFAHSTDTAGTTIGDCSVPVQGGKWSTPVPLTGSPSTADGVAATPIPSANYAVMPWLTAGSGGKVDLVYYGSTAATGLQPDSQAATWYLHMAQSLDGGSTWTDEQASETPNHVSSICFSGIGCTAQTPPGGDRNLLDFFQVKLDSTGRAVIIYTDDDNTAACAPTCSKGIGLISELQQATGPSLYSGNVPALAGGLSQSLDTRVAGANADVTDPAGDAVLPATGHNISGSNVPALDITDLKVCTVTTAACPVANTAANTVSFLFTLDDLAGLLSAPSSAVAGTHTGANWLVTWRWNNDLWYAQATVDASGTSLSCSAGRPLSVFNDGEPKAAEYTSSGNPEASVVSGCSTTGNTIEIDVPASDIGGIGGATTDEMYGLTAWTGNEDATLPAASCAASGINPSLDTCSGALGFFDNADETAPIDVLLQQPAVNSPESPSTVLLLLVGLVAIAGGAVVTRRRRRPAAVA